MKYSKQKMLVSFSGGLTSAYMSWWLKENKSNEYDFIFVFANTGQEHPKTLEFINNCDLFFNLNLVYLEAKVDYKKQEGTSYTIVDYKSLNRDGKPFEDVIKKYGLPNTLFPHCNRELKIQPIQTYMRDNNINLRAIGIREDEFGRATKNVQKQFPNMTVSEILEYRFNNEGFYYPLIKDRHTTKDEIKFWWKKMPFTLEIEEHYGNCVWCWKKSDRKLWTIAQENEHFFEFPKLMDKKYWTFIPSGQENGRVGINAIFRNKRTTQDLLNQGKNTNFIKFSPNDKLQLTIFNDEIDEDFSCNECGTIF